MFALGAKLSTTLNFPSLVELACQKHACNALDFQDLDMVMVLLQILVQPRLQERKNSFYDANHIPKQWTSNDLDFWTQHLQTLEMLDKKVSLLYCCISNTCKILSSRLTRDTVATQEKKKGEDWGKRKSKRGRRSSGKNCGDETSPQVACENTWKRSGRFVLGG